MRNNNLKIYLSGVMFSLLLIAGLSSCSEKEGWDTDPAYARLFKSLTFQQYSLDATSVGVDFSKVIDADRYLFEFSEDSLQFNNIKFRTSFQADTLKPYILSSTTPKTEYRIKFLGLNASTQYSVRMIAVNQDSSQTSHYSQFAFKTPSENIFAGVKATATGATFTWHPTSKVSYLVVTKDANPGANFLQADSLISNSEKADTTKTISGLDLGTYYTAKICYKDGSVVRVRGIVNFKTPGTAGSYSYNLAPGDTISNVLSRLVTQGHTNISIVLNGTDTYTWGALTLPAGITRLTVTASVGSSSVLKVDKITPATSMDGFLFENITMVGAGSATSTNKLFNIGTDNLNFGDFTFDGCNISGYNCLVYLNNKLITVKSITVNNSILKDMGGYGVLNVGGTSAALSDIKITKSTLIDLTTQLMDIRTTLNSLEVSNCTFYNVSMVNKLTQLFRFGSSTTTPVQMKLDKCIFSGNNGGTALKSFSSNYTPLTTFSFSTSYKTADLSVSTSTGTGFTGINALTQTSVDLFVDPANGNFKVKSDVVFSGKGSVGDPRWW